MEVIKKHAQLLVAAILLFFLVLSLVISAQESTTMDEKAHIPAGYSYVKYQDMRINPEHPPMLKDLAGLPLLWLDPQPVMPQSDPLWESGDAIDTSHFPEGPARTWGLAQWTFGDKILHQYGNNAEAITFWSRVPLIFVALLLGFFVYRWTRELAGVLAGLFALVLYAFDPNVIAHSHYVTTDVGIAAFLFLSFYYYVRFLKQPDTKNIVVSGLFLGLAQLAKFSAVLLFPIFGMFAVLYGFTLAVERVPGAWKTRIKNAFTYGLKYMGSVAVCFAAIWILYLANTWNMPATVIAEIARVQFPNDRAVGVIAEKSVVFMSEVPVLKPFAEYFLGVFMVFARVAGGNTYYFLGGVSNQASPWYFPVVFMLKETLPFLFLLLFSLSYSLIRIGKSFAREHITSAKDLFAFLMQSFQIKTVQYIGVFFVLFYSYISITGNLNIGFRHLFPILPFLYMFIAKTVFDFFKRRKNRVTGQFVGYAIGVFALAAIAIPVISYPSYLSYFNAVAGGSEHGYRYVTDSNYDWGQDLKRLRNFVEAQNRCKALIASGSLTTDNQCEHAFPALPAIEKIRVDYFGGSSPAYYLGDKFMPWHSHSDPEAGWYAISIGFFQESTHKDLAPGEQSYSWLKAYAPLTRAGDSLLIYYIPKK